MFYIQHRFKKLKLRLNCRADDELPFESAKFSNKKKILKISNNPNTLHIYAQLNQKEIPTVIDTGANICFIIYDTLPKNQTILSQTINLVGPDNQPLIVCGSTHIELYIENNIFHILTYV